MAGSAIATAYVQIVPTTGGIGSAISREFSEIGEQSGSQLSQGVGSGFKRNFALAGVIAGAVSAVTSSMISSISDLASQALTASDATDKFKKTLDFAGLDTKTIGALTKSTQAYADATVYNLGDIQNITAQLASNGVASYDKLAEAAGNLNAISGGNAETFKSVGMVLTQTAGAGKLTTENWNQLANAIPGASGKVQEALARNGAFTGNFRDAMAEGQITSEEFNAVLMELGTDPVAVEAARSTETFEGAIGNLQATITGQLASALTSIKPMATEAIGALSSFVSDIPAMLKAAVDWAKEYKDWIIVVASVITAVMLPAIVVWVTNTVAGWATTTAAAITGATSQLVQSYKTVAGWVVMGAKAIFHAGEVVVGWVLTAAGASANFLLTLPFYLATVAHWVAMGVQALLNAPKVVAGWVMTSVAATANFAISAAHFAGMVAGWVLMGVQALANAAKVVAGWAITAAGALVNAGIMAVQFGIVVAGWIAMGIQALIGAASMAAAWFIAIWPIALVIAAIAAVIAVVVLLAMNWDAVVKWITDVWSGFVEWIQPGLKAVGDAFSAVFNGIGKVISGVFEGIVWVIKTYINTILKVINAVIDGLNGVGSFISKATGGTIGFKLGKLPLLAEGGTITGAGSVIVGEKGPEMLNLNRGASVVPLDKASGQTIVYNAAPNTSLDSEQALFNAMRRAKVVGW